MTGYLVKPSIKKGHWPNEACYEDHQTFSIDKNSLVSRNWQFA